MPRGQGQGQGQGRGQGQGAWGTVLARRKPRWKSRRPGPRPRREARRWYLDSTLQEPPRMTLPEPVAGPIGLVQSFVQVL